MTTRFKPLNLYSLSSPQYILLFQDDDIDYKDGSNQSGFKQQYVTVYKTVNHIGVLNAPLVIGPQINNYNQPSVQQPFFNQVNLTLTTSNSAIKMHLTWPALPKPQKARIRTLYRYFTSSSTT